VDQIGAAFPHKEGIGFSIELKAFPIDGRLVVLPPDNDDNRSTINQPLSGALAGPSFMAEPFTPAPHFPDRQILVGRIRPA
jgi:hypothetical protein